MTSLSDVAAWRVMGASRELSEAHPGIAISRAPDDPALRERVQDALRPEALRALVATTGADSKTAAAASARVALSICVPAYLEAQAPELELRCRTRRRIELAPWGGDVDAALASEPEPRERRAIEDRFKVAADRLAVGESERLAARDEGARRLGPPDARGLRRVAREPGAVAAVSELERGFIAPLDDAVARAVRERWRGRPGGALNAQDSCDVPVMSWLPDRRRLCPAAGIAAILRRLGATLRFDPDTDGFRLEAVNPAPAGTTVWELAAPRAVVVLGTWGGPIGLADAFEAFGRAARATFLSSTRGPSSLWRVDPAYATAAGTLFRRIADSAAGPLFASNPAADARDELRLEALIAARRTWGTLAADDRSPSEARAVSLRAGGRVLAPGEAERSERDESDPWARLCGLMFGVLVEERLLSRFGRTWFSLPRAGSFLRDLWASETEGGARSMATAMGLGTMDSAPLFEAFRLGKGRAS
jgi:hypothetical protein